MCGATPSTNAAAYSGFYFAVLHVYITIVDFLPRWTRLTRHIERLKALDLLFTFMKTYQGLRKHHDLFVNARSGYMLNNPAGLFILLRLFQAPDEKLFDSSFFSCQLLLPSLLVEFLDLFTEPASISGIVDEAVVNLQCSSLAKTSNKTMKKCKTSLSGDEFPKLDQNQAFSSQSSDIDPSEKQTENLEAVKARKKQSSRRRKGQSKPRRIEKVEPSSAEEEESNVRGKSLDSVLKRVLKGKKEEDLKSSSDTTSNMIEVQESMSMHHHLPKGARATTTPPGSVESASSLYSNERQDMEQLVDNVVEPFVKVRPQSFGDSSPSRSPPCDLSNPLQISSSSNPMTRKSPISPVSLQQDATEMSQSVASTLSPASYSYDSMDNTSKTLVAIAAGMRLPTMILSSNIMTPAVPPLIAMQQFSRRASSAEEAKNSFEAPTNSEHTEGSRSTVASRQSNKSPSSPSAEARAQFKRPPHTYPALIASAILDSQGNLITLRGIYDYIMNNFPYYKYCHDKSAWQNSIRHNLSLNQCFVKVPRYENAAKSNYWTMTREGFEEFGNENSFKRRRRRGASLAPISAYKAKKYQDGSKAGGKSKTEQRNQSSATLPSPSVAAHPVEHRFDMSGFPPHLMHLAGGVWPSAFRQENPNENSRKRSQSPPDKEEAKNPRMMILKQGDGPTLDGIKREEPKRPNSLSSVEEMQGTLNFFSKALLNPASLAKASTSSPPSLSSSSQPWVATTQKTPITSSGLRVSPLTSVGGTSPERNPFSASSDKAYKDLERPVLINDVEIGSELTLRYETTEAPIRHYRCRFCPYTYVSTSSILLEQHARMVHQLELNNALSSSAVPKLPSNAKELSEQVMSLPSMLPGLASRNMMAVAQNNAHNFLAAAQASASGNAGSNFPYSGSFSTGLLNESVLKTLAEQVNSNTGPNSHERDATGLAGMEAFAHRQQAFNSVMQQAAAASTNTQDQFRMLYQHLALQNPFLANTAAKSALASAGFSRQLSTSDADASNQLKNQLWQQYQQKVANQMKTISNENVESKEISSLRRNSNSDYTSNPHHTSPRHSPELNPGTFEDVKRSIHGWKQCTQCDFTAKGDHGLDLHYRKAHAQSARHSSESDAGKVALESRRKPTVEPSTINTESPSTKEAFPRTTSSGTFDEQKTDDKMISPIFLTPPLSNSPSYHKRHFSALDLSGVKEEEDRKTSGSGVTTSTQTSTQSRLSDSDGNRTCTFCDISFGDDMMHALHMSCHDKVDPFQCTICGQKCNEKYYFNVHLLRGLHKKTSIGSEPRTHDSFIKEQSSDDVEVHCRHGNVNDAATSRSRSNSDTTPEGV